MAKIGRTQSVCARAGTLEFIFAKKLRRTKPRTHQLGIRPAGRDYGAGAVVARGVQLQRARHGQYGGIGQIRHARAARPVARAVDAGRNPLGIFDDRTRRGLFRCHQHRNGHQARRRRVRHQWPQVVVVGSHESALQNCDCDGQNQPRVAAPQPTKPNFGTHEHPRRENPAPAVGFWLQRLARRPRRSTVRKCAGSQTKPAVGRGARL